MGRRKKDIKVKTIMPTETDYCYLCGRFVRFDGHWHHCLHGTANRAIADKEGLIVRLCRECHTGGKYAVHNYRATDQMLERDAQDVWETQYIVKNDVTREEAREAFRKLFGNSFIYD